MIAERATAETARPTCDEHHCITCGDDGDPMTVVRVDPERGLALCADEEGARHTIETALVEPVTPGDRILVHAGTAIASLPAATGTTSEMTALVAESESEAAAQDVGASAVTKASAVAQ